MLYISIFYWNCICNKASINCDKLGNNLSLTIASRQAGNYKYQSNKTFKTFIQEF